MEKEYFGGYFRAANPLTEAALTEDGVKPFLLESANNHHEYRPEGDGNLYDSCYLPSCKYVLEEGDEAEAGIISLR